MNTMDVVCTYLPYKSGEKKERNLSPLAPRAHNHKFSVIWMADKDFSMKELNNFVWETNGTETSSQADIWNISGRMRRGRCDGRKINEFCVHMIWQHGKAWHNQWTGDWLSVAWGELSVGVKLEKWYKVTFIGTEHGNLSWKLWETIPSF